MDWQLVLSSVCIVRFPQYRIERVWKHHNLAYSGSPCCVVWTAPLQLIGLLVSFESQNAQPSDRTEAGVCFSVSEAWARAIGVTGPLQY